MTSRERVERALAHGEPDRTPIFEYVLQPPVADYFLGHRYADGEHWNELVDEKGWAEALRQRAGDIVQLAKALGHDLVYVPPVRPPVKGAEPPPPPLPVFNDPVEELEWRVARAEENFTPPPDEYYLIYTLLRQEMERAEVDLPIVAPAYAHGVWTDVALMQVMALAPELAHRHFALATRRAMLLIGKYVALGIEMIGVGGDFAGNRGPLISPAAYRRFIVPEVRKLSQRIHEDKRRAVNASDGDLWPVIDDFLTGCEVDGYLEIEMRAGMDLAELKKRFGSRITFFGNMDCSNELSTGTVDEVKRLVKECLQKGMGNGGHIFCCNNAITGSVPVKNYLAIGEAYREFFGLAPKI
ncbi:MAG: uroporphyrinogen decarboxylase family protein [Verrucomicrobiae bacterium]|nr:uroporphyrinogen decarboxylase family protein [Verrucomicrobiae bacterium]